MNEEQTAQVQEQQEAPATETVVEQTAAEPAKEADKPADNGNKTYDTLLGKPAEQGNQNDTDKTEKQEEQAVVYDLKQSIPEGFEYSEEESGKFIDAIKDMKLSNEQANAIAKYGFEWASRLREQFQAEVDSMVKEWGEIAKTELGADCDKVLAKAGSTISLLEKDIPNLRVSLAETGAGNRIEIIKAFALLADRMSGDPGKVTAAGAASATSNNEYAVRYPNTNFDNYR